MADLFPERLIKLLEDFRLDARWSREEFAATYVERHPGVQGRDLVSTSRQRGQTVTQQGWQFVYGGATMTITKSGNIWGNNSTIVFRYDWGNDIITETSILWKGWEAFHEKIDR